MTPEQLKLADHKEAFCLMWYACKCGHRERIWNSRDGVAPFGIGCRSCDDIMNHVEWGRDERVLDHNLIPGQRFFRDGTPDEAETIMRTRIEKSKGTRWEATPEVVLELIRAARNEDEGEFQKGWPMLDVFFPALRATPDARVKEALELAEKADEIHANCDECGGEGAPEECEFCFPSADDARIARRAASPGAGDLCPGGVNPDWDECQKCGATSDDECRYAAP